LKQSDDTVKSLHDKLMAEEGKGVTIPQAATQQFLFEEIAEYQ
jgi:hypothetical protein